MRRVFVGDIQGCLAPLQRLLEAVGFRPGTDRLHPAGDLVNKGPDSEAVLRLCIDLDAQSVLGNHDLKFLADGRIADQALAGWLRSQPAARVFDDLIQIHGGMHPEWDTARLAALTPAEIDYAVNVRYCDAAGHRPPSDWPPPGPPFRPWDDFYRGPQRVVFGHWARRGLVVRPQCVGLDTGCVYGGKLSAWIAEEDRIVQVPGL